MLFLRSPILLFSLSIFIHSQAHAATESAGNITSGNPLRIGVPAYPFSERFVKISRVENSQEKIYDGFCIQVFEEVINLLGYGIPYEFVEFGGSYDDLVSSVANKTFDAAVGDITITAQRYTMVEFTEPFTESGLSMVIPVKPVPGWIFLRPFTANLWIATGGILVYTMFAVWFIEHRSNPEFSGPWRDQLGNAMWFTFSSLFFAHRERISSSHTRVLVVVWLFVVLILTQSYTASLTSMLTVTRLNPTIESLRTDNAKVGCDDTTLMKTYVENELGYNLENIKLFVGDGNYLNAFRSGSISAAFLEIPYAKLFVNAHCKEFTITGSSYRFGGLGFAFQNGSLAHDVSEAILKLSESGTLKCLEEKWLTSSSECSDSDAADSTDSLSFRSFWGLYLFSAGISTFCSLLFIVRLLRDYQHHGPSQGRVVDENIWTKTVEVLKYLKSAEPRDRSPSEVVPEIEMLQEQRDLTVNK